jgi:hypothetical protein
MRLQALVLGMLAVVPLCAQEPESYWFLDVHKVATTFTGHFDGTQNGNAIQFDLQKDLALDKSATRLGGSIEYEGPRFGLELSSEEQDYKGSGLITEQIQIGGRTFNAETYVTSNMKAINTTFNWTIRFLKFPEAWLGVDLGARVLAIDLQADDFEPISGYYAYGSFENTVPIPQLGLSGGFHILDDKIMVRGFYHYLGYKGATYKHTGVDARYFPLKWLGLRVFTDKEAWTIPSQTVAKDLDFALDRQGTGGGVVLRW